VAASSSRRSVVKAIGLCSGVAAASTLGALYWMRARDKPAALPRFALAHGAEVTCLPPDATARQRELQVAAWLAFATLAPSAQGRLLTALESLLDSLEARLHPLGVDLLEESPEQIARHEAPWLLPIWTAARTIARRCFVAGDHSLVVLVGGVATPLPAAHARFDPFDTTSEDPKLRLARFLCWPISAAVRVKLGTDPARALRERCGAPASKLALVIDGSAQTVDAGAIQRDTRERMQALKERLSRLVRPKCKDCESIDEVVSALARGLPAAPALDWLELGEGEALAVPRLRAVSERDAFLRELEELSIPIVAHLG